MHVADVDDVQNVWRGFGPVASPATAGPCILPDPPPGVVYIVAGEYVGPPPGECPDVIALSDDDPVWLLHALGRQWFDPVDEPGHVLDPFEPGPSFEGVADAWAAWAEG